MIRQRRNIDAATIQFQTSGVVERLRAYRSLLAKIDADAERTKRLAACECPMCFYERSRIGGCALTSAQCAFCDETLHSGNTNIDVTCQACAKIAGICKHCGADVDLKNRRKRVLPTKTLNAVDDD